MKGWDRQRRLLAAFAGTAGAGAILLVVYLLWPVSTSPLDDRYSGRTGKPQENPSPIRFRWQFEGAIRMNLRQVDEDHYAISFPDDKVNYFIFKVEGAKGRTLRFSFEGVPANHWAAIRPVCGYPPNPTPGGTSDLDDLAFYEPDKKGQSRWRYIEQMDLVHEKEIAYTHTFASDAAYVALRVPYTLGYQQRWLETLPKQKGLEVITIGHSAEGRPLTLIKIGRGDEQAERENPCVLIYAREHCDEPDSSWVAQGAVRYLLADSADSEALRERTTFLVIPMLDPDGWARGMHENYFRSFAEGRATTESSIVASWLDQRVGAGSRLAIVLNLHNPEPRAYPHLLCRYIEAPAGRVRDSRLCDTAVQFRLAEAAYVARSSPESVWTTSRLGGWLGYHYAPLPILYEVNSQYLQHPLELSNLHDLGRRLTMGVTDYLSSSAGLHFMARVDRQLAFRTRMLATNTGRVPGEDVIDAISRLNCTILTVADPERFDDRHITVRDGNPRR